MTTLVIATKNAGKAREYRKMLAPHGITVKTLADFAPIKINENGTSFEENATIKAQTVMAALNLPVMADDSGLVVDALNPDGAKLVANGRVDGRILHERHGENGFGYDPLFFVESLGKSMAELTADQKNAISHRGAALREFMAKFPEWWRA